MFATIFAFPLFSNFEKYIFIHHRPFKNGIKNNKHTLTVLKTTKHGIIREALESCSNSLIFKSFMWR